MVLDLTKLLNGFTPEVTFDDTIEFDSSHLDRADIRRLSPIRVSGKVERTSDDLCTLEMLIEGVMILPCSVSLEDVEYPFSIDVSEILEENDKNEEDYIRIINKNIDILPIVWQNIVMEIPLKIVSPNVDRRNISGIGWKLITEDDLENNKEE